MAIIGAFQFSNLIINHAELNGKSVLTNGLEAMQKYNPITGVVVPLVLRPFRQDIALAAGGAGNLTGHYVYRIVPYNENEDEEGESYPDDETVAAFEIDLAAQSCNINLAALVADNAEVTHVRIYRTLANGPWPAMFRVATVALPAGVYNDNIEDQLLGENEGLDVAIQVPTPKPFLCVHKSRMFAWGDVPYDAGEAHVTNGSPNVTGVGDATFGFYLIGKEFHAQGDGRAYMIDGYDPAAGALVLRDNYDGITRDTEYRICGDADTLIWTDPFREHTWAANNNLPINKKEDDKPAGMAPQGRRLILAKSKRTYALYYGNDPSYQFSEVATLSTEHGCVSHRTMRVINGTLHWLSRNGIVAAPPESSVQLVSDALGEWITDNLILDGNGERQIACAQSLKMRNQYVCFFPGPLAMVGCDLAIVYHIKTGKFSTYRFLTEFTCAELVQDVDGAEGIVLGDRWGFLWQYPYGHIDGAPAGSTLSGNVDSYHIESSPGCWLEDLDAHFPTVGLGLAGVPIYIYEGTGAGQHGIVGGNSETMIWLMECFNIPLDATSRYYLGPIIADYQSGWHDFGAIDRAKRLMYANLVFDQNDSDLRFNVYGDFDTDPEDLTDRNPRVPTADREDFGIVEMDGDDEDAEHPRGRKRVKLGGIRRTHYSWEVLDYKPNNPWSLLDLSFDVEFKEN